MKSFFLTLMATMALSAGAAVVLDNPQDFNNDNAVDVGDINVVLGSILDSDNSYFLDTNGDGRVDVGDVNTVLNTILVTPPNNETQIAAANLLLKCYANFSVTGEGGRNGYNWLPDIDAGTSALYRQMWNLNELTTDEAMCVWGDPGIRELNYNFPIASTPQLYGYWSRLYLGIDFCNQYIATYGELDPMATAEARLLRAFNYMLLLDAFGNVPVTTTPGDKTPAQWTRARVFNWVESELLATLDDLADPKPKSSRSMDYGRVDRAAAWLLLSRLYLNAEVYSGTPRWSAAAAYAKLVIDSPYQLVTDASNRDVDGLRWHFTAYQKLFMGDNDRTNAAGECLMPVIHDSRKEFWTSWSTSVFVIGGTFDWNMIEHPAGLDAVNGTTQYWSGLHARPDLVRKFIAEDEGIPAAMGYQNAGTFGDDRALINSSGRTLDITDPSVFTNGFSVAKFTNFSTDGSLNLRADIPDADIFLLRKAEAYLTYAEALTRQEGGSVTPGDAANAINALRTRANATLMRSYTLDQILDEWSREFYFEGRRRMDLVRFGQYGGENAMKWQWKGGVIEGQNFPAELNLFPIPAQAMAVNPNLKQNPGYEISVPETFELRLATSSDSPVDLQTERVFAFDWDRPDYGNPMARPQYTLEMDINADFSSVRTLVQSYMIDGTNVDVSPEDVNTQLSLLTASMDETTVYFRCIAAYNNTTVVSNAVSRTVKPYFAMTPAQWYVIGGNIGDVAWDNSESAVGTSIAPMYPVKVERDAYTNRLQTTLTYTALFTEGDMFKFISKPGYWDDQYQLSYYASLYLCDGIVADEYDSRQFRATTTGYYSITLECTNGSSSSQSVTFTKLGSTPSAFSSIAIAGEFNGWTTSATPLKPLRNHDNHDWWTSITFDQDTEFKFTANDAWEFNWGAEAFPYGTGVQDGANITAKAGSYTVFFNDITGQYVFLSDGNATSDRSFYITEADAIDFNTASSQMCRIFVPHYYAGHFGNDIRVTFDNNGKTYTATTNGNGYLYSLQSILSALDLMNHTDNDFTLHFTLPDNGNQQGSVRVLHPYVTDRRYFVGDKEMEPISGTDRFKVELEMGESWIITDDHGQRYGLRNDFPTDMTSGFLTCTNPVAGVSAGDYTLQFDPWQMTFRLDEHTEFDFNYIYIAGSHNGWGSSVDYLYSATKNGVFIGYAYLDGEFKFRSHELSWDAPDWGGNGNAGELGQYGYNLSAAAGFYRIEVDLNTMLYRLTPITVVSLIGEVNGGLWDTDTDLTYNATKGAWEGDMSLTAGDFKFRANHDWACNWGGGLNSLVELGPNCSLAQAGTYHIELYLSCETRHHYTITKL